MTRRAAIYTRFSTDLQNERSCEDQAALCRAFAARNDLRVVAEYADKARSGASTIGRDGLAKLLEEASAGRFEVVIVEALDRLARDMEDLAGIHKRLSFIGVEIITVYEGVADTVAIGLRGLVGQLFREDGVKKIRRGMAGVVREGRSAGGRAYGYRPTPGKIGELEIVEEEAEIVRRIFSEYVSRKSPRDIAAGLNRDGVAPPRGRRWNASTINGNLSRGHGILLNPIYDGRIIWNRVRMVRDPSTGKRVSRINPESEWQYADAAHLRIVDRETFEAAQARKNAETRPGGVRTHGNRRRILSGLLRCGSCGGGMTAHDVYAGRRRIVCSAVKESGSCDNTRRYYLDEIEREVVESLLDELDQPTVTEGLVAGARRGYEEELRAARRDISEWEKGHDRALAAQRRLLGLVERGLAGDLDSVSRRLRELDSEAKALAKKIEMAREDRPPPIELDVAEFRRYASDLRGVFEDFALGDAPVSAEVRALFVALLSKVVVGPVTKNPVTKEEELPLKIEIRLTPLMALNKQALFTDEEKQSMMEHYLGGKMVAEEGLEPPTQGL
jgi:site-specific DNA recombinase